MLPLGAGSSTQGALPAREQIQYSPEAPLQEGLQPGCSASAAPGRRPVKQHISNLIVSYVAVSSLGALRTTAATDLRSAPAHIDTPPRRTTEKTGLVSFVRGCGPVSGAD